MQESLGGLQFTPVATLDLNLGNVGNKISASWMQWTVVGPRRYPTPPSPSLWRSDMTGRSHKHAWRVPKLLGTSAQNFGQWYCHSIWRIETTITWDSRPRLSSWSSAHGGFCYGGQTSIQGNLVQLEPLSVWIPTPNMRYIQASQLSVTLFPLTEVSTSTLPNLTPIQIPGKGCGPCRECKFHWTAENQVMKRRF